MNAKCPYRAKTAAPAARTRPAKLVAKVEAAPVYEGAGTDSVGLVGAL